MFLDMPNDTTNSTSVLVSIPFQSSRIIKLKDTKKFYFNVSAKDKFSRES